MRYLKLILWGILTSFTCIQALPHVLLLDKREVGMEPEHVPRNIHSSTDNPDSFGSRSLIDEKKGKRVNKKVVNKAMGKKPPTKIKESKPSATKQPLLKNAPTKSKTTKIPKIPKTKKPRLQFEEITLNPLIYIQTERNEEQIHPVTYPVLAPNFDTNFVPEDVLVPFIPEIILMRVKHIRDLKKRGIVTQKLDLQIQKKLQQLTTLSTLSKNLKLLGHTIKPQIS